MGNLLINPHFFGHPDVIDLESSAVYSWICLATAAVRDKRPDGFVGEHHIDSVPIRDLMSLMARGLLHDVDGSVFLGHGNHHPYPLWRMELRTEYRAKIPAWLREAVYERDGYACVECGATDDLSLDHIHPWSLGGPDTFENLRTLCRPCNSRKGARPIAALGGS